MNESESLHVVEEEPDQGDHDQHQERDRHEQHCKYIFNPKMHGVLYANRPPPFGGFLPFT